ncbi:hypothetical protein QRD90_23550 [Peribacillus frigoritolerans]|uniref:hypothetical protein n=1 Tax=Peribacillus frigoritolerans TaxID=450367 RepID=UPI00207A691D|nr:hypothetical protein [Peribacillus frigoritolerans]USK79845.1 hypothetical protein LHV56_24015 [Peribacillus frigoritolerans]WJE47131.1 hypothetical protein QRD90_23550 [Peribacillus frigoritolerans]
MSLGVLLVKWRLTREFSAFTREFSTFTREFCRSLPYFIKITIQTRVDRMDLFWYYSYSG